ncbi:VOC family protein [uncultured Enterovirga sp.]|uniref:VOC family protein n=1 Tax=uncultured Enterovirga sp. TaxID=2026352 RepID=UPI0035CC4D22
MSVTPKHFTWYELMTTEPEAAASFYRDVVGWKAEPAESAPIPYWLLHGTKGIAAGLMGLSAEDCTAGKRPGWIGSIETDDVDATVQRVAELGGAVHVPPMDIPNVARFAIVADPQGAVFGLMRWVDAPAQAALMTTGHAGWHELMAAEWEAVFPFYENLFGWRKLAPIDMGPIGTYQLFGIEDGEGFGGMFTKPPEVPAPFWLYYISVPSIDAAKARVEALGGQVLNGPMEVPGGMWIIQFLDPQGAMTALVGPR